MLPFAEVSFASLDEDIRMVMGRSAMWGGVFTYDAREMTFTFDPPPPGSRDPGI